MKRKNNKQTNKKLCYVKLEAKRKEWKKLHIDFLYDDDDDDVRGVYVKMLKVKSKAHAIFPFENVLCKRFQT